MSESANDGAPARQEERRPGQPPTWAWWVIGILVPVIGIVATVWATSNKSEGPAKAAPAASSPATSSSGPEPTDVAAERTPTPTERESDLPTPTGSPEEGSDAEKVLLSTLEQVEGTRIVPKRVTFRGKEYPDSLASDSTCPARGSVSYNLGTQWDTFTFTAGIDDNSAATSGSLTVTADGKTLWTGEVTLGAPRDLTLSVKDVLRLEIAYEHGNGCSGWDSWVALGDATLLK
ncbi:NPCBM/NEW2 domain-containing protein [Streptomyces abyssomicinicus]|uniref:NPCBM/NEW2 domain-containing protein n=1 Tax=Streptomyces abyssomicinicus TaxID=574929 RepID=UPI001250664B|nr:NPCBM/NEW2 domain-containing protein [Streptomyces abyssomicinicus]